MLSAQTQANLTRFTCNCRWQK